MRNLLFCIDVHLTVLTIKLQTKLPPIGKHEMERLAPLWTLATTTHAIAQSVPQTMATLHDQVGRVLGKIFRPTLLISLGQTRKSAGSVEAGCVSIGYIIGIGESLILSLPALASSGLPGVAVSWDFCVATASWIVRGSVASCVVRGSAASCDVCAATTS